MLTPRVFVNGAEVLAQGVAVGVGNQPIDLYLFPPPNQAYQIRLSFQQKPGEQPSVLPIATPPNLFTLTFSNFDNSAGVGMTAPSYVANHDGRKILLSAYIFHVGQPGIGTRLVAYILHDGGPVVG